MANLLNAEDFVSFIKIMQFIFPSNLSFLFTPEISGCFHKTHVCYSSDLTFHRGENKENCWRKMRLKERRNKRFFHIHIGLRWMKVSASFFFSSLCQVDCSRLIPLAIDALIFVEIRLRGYDYYIFSLSFSAHHYAAESHWGILCFEKIKRGI